MRLPILKTCTISNFSLYGKNSEVTVDLSKPVTVLAGANGLGKSTFLNIISFALTGIVKDFHYEFKGIYDINKQSSFKDDYFKGRVNAIDKNIANVSLTFQIGSKTATIIRTFKSKTPFYSFKIDNQNESFSEDYYKSFIISEIGLKSFDQFIFLVQYVFLFDESRTMVFWNSRILTNAIGILLGVDTELAEQSDLLAKKINTLTSNYNHTTWDIGRLKTYMKELSSNLSDESKNNDIEKMIETLDSLEAEKKQFEEQQNNLNIELNSIKAIITELSSKEYKLKNEYDLEYNKIFSQSIDMDRILKNEYLISLLDDNKCNLCGHENVDKNIIESKISNHICPLCNSNIEKDEPSFDISKLESLDKDLSEVRNIINTSLAQQKLLSEKQLELSNYIVKLDNDVLQIKASDLYKNLSSYSGDNSTIRKLIETNDSAIKVLEAKKLQFEAERNLCSKEAAKLRDMFVEQYNGIKDIFIPIFCQLASQFLGLDVNLNLDEFNKYNRAEFKFTLSIGETDRLFVHQLSESQKFFIDIALRMALITYVSKQNKDRGGFLLLDTPEGSLDIAYEINAGIMMSKYILNDTQLLMTTNINSSGLLRALARKSNKDDFNLIRMINWSKLSEVQQVNKIAIENILDSLEMEVGKEYEYPSKL